MKLAYLLAQYLYAQKRLDLPGIGTFRLDPSANTDTDNSRQRQAISESISFESNPAMPTPQALISYISEKSGKMKALAISDLESHLEIAHQFLNIGKPFLFEGIGSVVKVRAGVFDFIPGSILPDKLKDPIESEAQSLSKKDNVDAKYQAFLATPAGKTPWRKPVMFLLVLAGIALAVWGGYIISTGNSDEEELTLSEVNTTPQPVIDSAALRVADSIALAKKKESENYKYVLEIAKSKRAFNRYNQLKENQWPVQLETNDSIQYKLYLILPATQDTAWKMDSLTALSGRKVYIEHSN